MNDPHPTLGDLLDESGLGLELVVGGGASRDRRIAGAHSIEQRHPVPWLGDDWVMLTTGSDWATDREQRTLIYELAEGAISALGFGIDVQYRDVPRALLRAAERLNFPVFTIPGPTSFRDVIATVYHLTHDADVSTFSRLTAIQRFLNDSLREPNAVASMIDRLGKMLGAEVAVAQADGSLIEGTCATAAPTLGALFAAANTGVVRIECAETRGWALSIGDDGPASGAWLVVGAAPGRIESRLLKPAAQAALPLLDAVAHLKSLRIAEERAAKRAILDTLLHPATPQDADVAGARAAAWNIDPSEGVRVVIARRVRGFDAVSADRLGEIVGRLEAATIPALATTRADDVELLLPANVELERVETVLLELDPQQFFGVGRVVSSGRYVSASRSDADLALRWNRRTDSRCLSYDDLDLASTLIAEVPTERIRPKVQQWLDLLIANPIAVETLTAYFEHDLDVGRTSRALHLHPNSTRYRLSRVEELLGVRLRRPSTIATLHLALLAREYSGEPSLLSEAVQLAEPVAPVA